MATGAGDPDLYRRACGCDPRSSVSELLTDRLGLCPVRNISTSRLVFYAFVPSGGGGEVSEGTHAAASATQIALGCMGSQECLC
jgi:hypothetical protein